MINLLSEPGGLVMRPLRSFVLAVPVLATIAVPFAPAEAHRRQNGGAALIAGLIGLGLGAVAGNAFTARSDQYEPTYSQPNYGPSPGYGYGPAYAAPPPILYAPPSVIYAQPPVVAYAPSPGYYAPRGVYAPPRPRAYQDGPVDAGWDDDN